MITILLITLALAAAAFFRKRKRKMPNVRVTEKTAECKVVGSAGSAIMTNTMEYRGPNRPPLIILDSDYDSFITVFDN